jgi:hypothetical protein
MYRSRDVITKTRSLKGFALRWEDNKDRDAALSILASNAPSNL